MAQEFNESQKQFVVYRQDSRCGNCGENLAESMKIELHHVLNKKDGGAGIVENAVMLCGECHLHIHNYDTKKSILVFRSEFKYANWKKNSEYRGRKKGKEVKFTKQTLDKFDKQGAKVNNKSYENHLKMISQLKQTLTALQNKIESLKDNYKKQIDAMESATFMDNYITPLRSKYSEFSQIIDTLQNMIDEHKAQIALHEEALEHLIIDARG